MPFPSMVPGVFFRPEEDTFLSEHIDDVGVFQMGEINVGNEDNGTAIRFRATAVHITVDLQQHGAFAVRAFRFNLNSHVLLSQPPLHEGRCKRVCCSSGIQPLSRIKTDSVRGFFNRHRISPDDLPLLIPVQESQVFFQIV
jgi:hypothetical protein